VVCGLHRFSNVASYCRKSLILPTLRIHLAARLGVTPSNFPEIFDRRKLEFLGYRAALFAWSVVQRFWYNIGLWRTNRRTDTGPQHIPHSTSVALRSKKKLKTGAQNRSAEIATSPNGLTLIPWQCAKFLTWDVTVVSTLADSYLHASSYSAGDAAEIASVRKEPKYSLLPPDYIFQTVAFETLGSLNSSGDFLCEVSADV